MSENSTELRQSRSVVYASVAVLVIIIVFSILRIKLYGDPALSIAGNDTITYIEAGQVPLFSAEILTGRRLLTTNLLYKAFEPENGYEILVNGSVDTTRRVFQPGFDKIVILQLILSLLGWGALAWFVAESLRDPWLKVIGAILILLFAYTPQMADWDSILMSESLTFSLFALQLALLIKLASDIYKNPEAKITHWAIMWGLVFFFWTFLRDTNLFTALMSIAMISLLFVSQRYRKSKSLRGIIVFLTLTFLLGIYTSSISVRSTVQLINLYKDDIFPHPERVSYFEKFGMPAFETSEFRTWVEEKGSSSMAQFMLSHPGYPTLKILRDFEPAFHEIKQTYFTANNLNPSRDVLFAIGNAFHPENTTPFLMSLLVLLGFVLLAAKNVDNSRLWTWIGLWLFLSSSLTLIPTILGDTWALNRHALYSTTIFRLTPLVFSVILMDIALHKKETQPN